MFVIKYLHEQIGLNSLFRREKGRREGKGKEGGEEGEEKMKNGVKGMKKVRRRREGQEVRGEGIKKRTERERVGVNKNVPNTKCLHDTQLKSHHEPFHQC